MALDVDGFAVFRGIGSHPGTFAAIAADIGKMARTLVVRQIRDKSTGLKAVRDIRAAIGAEAFSLIADGIADAQIKSLAARLDKHNAQLRTSKGAAQRLHVLALADGSAEPVQKSNSVSKTAKAESTQAPLAAAGRIQFSSAGATRKR